MIQPSQRKIPLFHTLFIIIVLILAVVSMVRLGAVVSRAYIGEKAEGTFTISSCDTNYNAGKVLVAEENYDCVGVFRDLKNTVLPSKPLALQTVSNINRGDRLPVYGKKISLENKYTLYTNSPSLGGRRDGRVIVKHFLLTAFLAWLTLILYKKRHRYQN